MTYVAAILLIATLVGWSTVYNLWRRLDDTELSLDNARAGERAALDLASENAHLAYVHAVEAETHKATVRHLEAAYNRLDEKVL